MRNLNVRMQDSIYVRFGRAEGDRIADEVYQRMTDWAFAATDHPAFRDQVETISMLWHWHRTPFRLLEDDEKVSYIMQPCGSGRPARQRRRLSPDRDAAAVRPGRPVVRVVRRVELPELVRALRVLEPWVSEAVDPVLRARGLERPPPLGRVRRQSPTRTSAWCRPRCSSGSASRRRAGEQGRR